MTTALIILCCLILLVMLGVGYVIKTYNGLVRLRANAEEAWSDIQVQMKRRYNLVPNLVETVKGYARHESETLTNVVAARNKAAAASGSPAEQLGPENMFAGALHGMMALAESYPDLKADAGFRDLQATLAELEEHINRARRYYNGNVRELNIRIESFPSDIIAGMYNFEKRDFFELEEFDPARAVPEVKF